MELVVIDATDTLRGQSAGAGELSVAGVADLGRQMHLVAGHKGVTALHILDRGFRGGVQLGADWITKSSLPRFADDFAVVADALADGAVVHLHNCLLDDTHPVMLQAARLLGARLIASRGLQHAGLLERSGRKAGGKNPFGGFGRILARGQVT